MSSMVILLILYWLTGGSDCIASDIGEDDVQILDTDNSKCDSIVCASIVSKCLLTSHCKCDNMPGNKTCSNSCSRCLDYLYEDCCLCFDLCDKAKGEDESGKAAQFGSNVGHVKDPQPDFFSLLTEYPDPMDRWKALTYSMILPIDEQNGSPSAASATGGESENQDLELKCTVAYMAQCTSFNKCKKSCASMGSSTFRWFHDGCCECVGQYCNDFGLDRSNCTACPLIVSAPEKEL